MGPFFLGGDFNLIISPYIVEKYQAWLLIKINLMSCSMGQCEKILLISLYKGAPAP